MRQPQGMAAAPVDFTGTLSELFDQHVQAALPSRDSVVRFHEWMCRYADIALDAGEDRVFPVRAVRGTARRDVFETSDGTRIAPADNSPAWVVHALLVSAEGEHPVRLKSWADFHRLMTRQIATHMFDVPKCVAWSANTFGWYVAHVIPAKNRDTSWREWTRQEVTRRFFRTLHPCNLFLIPGVHNQELGESSEVIAFMAARLAEWYGTDLWNDFVSRSVGPIAICSNPSRRRARGALRVQGRDKEVSQRISGVLLASSAHLGLKTEPATLACAGAQLAVKAQYRATRLTFRRDVIEALADDDAFEVETPFGTFRFTKRQFYADFPRIPLTASYREMGLYHGAQLHLKALHRRIRE
jgi:hypothetical protein